MKPLIWKPGRQTFDLRTAWLEGSKSAVEVHQQMRSELMAKVMEKLDPDKVYLVKWGAESSEAENWPDKMGDLVVGKYTANIWEINMTTDRMIRTLFLANNTMADWTYRRYQPTMVEQVEVARLLEDHHRLFVEMAPDYEGRTEVIKRWNHYKKVVLDLEGQLSPQDRLRTRSVDEMMGELAEKRAEAEEAAAEESEKLTASLPKQGTALRAAMQPMLGGSYTYPPYPSDPSVWNPTPVKRVDALQPWELNPPIVGQVDKSVDKSIEKIASVAQAIERASDAADKAGWTFKGLSDWLTVNFKLNFKDEDGNE